MVLSVSAWLEGREKRSEMIFCPYLYSWASVIFFLKVEQQQQKDARKRNEKGQMESHHDSCQCRTASASEKATQRARPKQAVVENEMNSPAFRFISDSVQTGMMSHKGLHTSSSPYTFHSFSIQHYQSLLIQSVLLLWYQTMLPLGTFNNIKCISDFSMHLNNQSKTHNIAWSIYWNETIDYCYWLLFRFAGNA